MKLHNSIYRISTCVLAVLACGIHTTTANEDTHVYTDGEPVIMWLNRVGPYHNTFEGYPYYALPYCAPPRLEHTPAKRSADLGEILEGLEYVNSDLPIQFNSMCRLVPGPSCLAMHTTRLCVLVLVSLPPPRAFGVSSILLCSLG